ncbi:MAG TPA: hypothetical protein QF753_11860 [Victivallales bacterium]|nr:hypothetical protein [Victivallales bacterium]
MKKFSSFFLISFIVFLFLSQISNMNAYTFKTKPETPPSPPVDYYVISLRRVANEAEIESALDKAGKKGWILVSVIEGVQANRLYIFKKMNIFDKSPQFIHNIAEIKKQLEIIAENTKPEEVIVQKRR